MLDGIPLMYTGQEEPMPHRLKFFDKDTVGFKDFAYADFYKKLFKIKHENPALWNADYGGPLIRVMPHEDIFAFERSKGDNHILVVINLSKLKLSVPAHRNIGGMELLSGKPINFNQGDGISLKPWESVVVKL
jgi:cyclomaltodextrinase / maltogenic alpha-amylase / neopullulanase